MSPFLPFLVFLRDIPYHHLIIEIYWYHFIYQLPSSFYIRGRCSTWHLPQLQSAYIIPRALDWFQNIFLSTNRMMGEGFQRHISNDAV